METYEIYIKYKCLDCGETFLRKIRDEKRYCPGCGKWHVESIRAYT